MEGFLAALVVSFGVIFVAELGDKSQLMALTFATRYKPVPVLIGITVATAVVHLASVAIGYGLGAALPTGWISLVAGLAFLGFGAWTLRGDTLTEEEKRKAEKTGKSADRRGRCRVLPGRAGRQDDARHHHPGHPVRLVRHLARLDASAWWPPTRWPSWSAGCSAGKLPEKTIRYGAAVLFAICGLWLILEAVDRADLTADPYRRAARRVGQSARGAPRDHHLPLAVGGETAESGG